MAFGLTNRRSWVWSAAKLACVLVVWGVLPAGLFGLDAYGRMVPIHTAPASIDVSVAEIPSRVSSARGFQVGGLERGFRGWTAYDEISSAFVRTLIASEDARFFVHDGVDPEAIARAALANRAAGRPVQGGSTITQQLAKSFVGDARTMERKLAELVVARRLEQRFSKAEILTAYVNRVYFGAGATGVGAAARIYFGVEPRDLDLSQSALLAALIPAPGRYNPFEHPELALVRRDRVLDRVLDAGYATHAEVAEARAHPLGLRPTPEQRVRAPELERAAWRAHADLELPGDPRWGNRSHETTVDLARQRQAQRAIRNHVFALDRRQGWRGPEGRVTDDGATAFREAWVAAGFSGEVLPALVTSANGSTLGVWAGEEIRLAEDAWNWAIPWDPAADNHDESIDDADDAFAVGDVVLLRVGGPGSNDPIARSSSAGEGGEGPSDHDRSAVEIVQWPLAEAAFVSLDPVSGLVETLVGGFDAERSEFDRVSQGCRQPGSTFKPVVYSAAFDRGYTPATLLRDGPIRVELGPFEEWSPRNADGSFDGVITLWEAFVWSRNLPVLGVYADIGAAATIQRARSLGIESDLDAVESLALGASCVRPMELARVYSVFANGGYAVEPSVLGAVRDSGGRAIFLDGGVRAAHLRPAERAAILWDERAELIPPRVDPRNAYLVGFLLAEAVRVGTGRELSASGIAAAGKTGTTNAYDAWFAGFTAREVAVTWVGSDRNVRPLGRGETGGHLALPLWADAVTSGWSEEDLLPAPPFGIEFAAVEPESGRLAPDDRWGVTLPFTLGTAPQRTAPTRARLNAVEVDRRQREF